MQVETFNAEDLSLDEIETLAEKARVDYEKLSRVPGIDKDTLDDAWSLIQELESTWHDEWHGMSVYEKWNHLYPDDPVDFSCGCGCGY
ncbi:MAG: hypothetical protein CL489_10675 [Acidobacteria bacterium]|nr:hypothetical protein [Acidobacteriota bacterium]|tara:strand:- start:1456 stop:1719 length:264 start_codon:yes stop_codon:yes gene_type:complete